MHNYAAIKGINFTNFDTFQKIKEKEKRENKSRATKRPTNMSIGSKGNDRI
jgi:hypothetical protein